jgi:hypothetical protein
MNMKVEDALFGAGPTRYHEILSGGSEALAEQRSDLADEGHGAPEILGRDVRKVGGVSLRDDERMPVPDGAEGKERERSVGLRDPMRDSPAIPDHLAEDAGGRHAPGISLAA